MGARSCLNIEFNLSVLTTKFRTANFDTTEN